MEVEDGNERFERLESTSVHAVTALDKVHGIPEARPSGVQRSATTEIKKEERETEQSTKNKIKKIHQDNPHPPRSLTYRETKGPRDSELIY